MGIVGGGDIIVVTIAPLMTITSVHTETHFKIFINDILHLCLTKSSVKAVHAFIDERHFIELHMTTGRMRLEYDTRDKWVKVLALLNEFCR